MPDVTPSFEYAREQGRRFAEALLDDDNEATQAIKNAVDWAAIGYDKMTEEQDIPSIYVAAGIASAITAGMMAKAMLPPEEDDEA
jgi:hypothetical protein